MSTLTNESKLKLQRILSKRLGRELSEIELEQAYEGLMGFAEALMELDKPESIYQQNQQNQQNSARGQQNQQNQQNIRHKQSKQNKQKSERAIAKSKESVLQYV